MKLVFALVALVGLSACGGGGGSPSTVQVVPSSLADSFIKAAAADGVKISKLEYYNQSIQQPNTVLVQNGSVVQAYDLTSYVAGQDFSDFVAANPGAVHSGLLPSYYSEQCDVSCLPKDIAFWYDPVTDMRFEETSASGKDLQKIAAFKQSYQVAQSASVLRARFGLSVERSTDVARLAVSLAGRNRRSMTDADYNAFAGELTGSTMLQIRSAARASTEGSPEAMNDVISRAARVNGVGPEHMNEILRSLLN